MNSTILLNNYRIIRELGKGGFGKTYLAESSNRKRCVIKEFAPSQENASEQATQLFRQEAERLKEVGTHPQIPEFYDFFEEGSRLFIVQEYIAGESLQQSLQKGQTFTEEEIDSLLKGILPLLRYLHGSGVIHRDIKPANIIRRQSDGALVLVDFGAAKRVSETVLAKTGTMIGSVGYASTEQMRGKTTFASDIYSLGMTCIHLLTGTSPMSIAADPMTGALQWRLELAGKPVREEFADVLDKMIDDVLGRRFQSADAALQALKEADPADITKKEESQLARDEEISALARQDEQTTLARFATPAAAACGVGTVIIMRPIVLNTSDVFDIPGFSKITSTAMNTSQWLFIGLFLISAVRAFTSRQPTNEHHES
ncbi:Serine/threonine-protein kinase C [Acaryochloris thomasi RCC1774]|uniref:non-specific serine/threonine protein kinase n=1 Tax=Acaryochloris thomasi RCC1774 TaxID=1764569 RepID=A0A2W1J880_9CYAN|nr:serine/threonine-protein kinase [Acaryochloris thomasi]PZD70623.1 Serine/threonine-protein kinase C [Acaryochloris thomasi RCC1774]